MKPRRRVIIISAFILVIGLLVEGYIYFHPELPRLTSRGCPWLARVMPLPHTSIARRDYIEMVSWQGKPPTTPYTIRLYADGQIEQDSTISLPGGITLGCPLRDADRHRQIPAAEASAFIRKIRDAGFCRLCIIYQERDPTIDSGYSGIVLTIAGKQNRVFNTSLSPPPLFVEASEHLRSLVSLPEYATATQPSRERMQDCARFDMQQAQSLSNRLSKRP